VYGVFIAVHLLICIGLIISVLLQSSKGEGLAGAFGGGGMTGTVFGGRGAATFLAKATTVLAISFFASAMILSFMNPSTGVATGGPQGESAVQEAAGQLPAAVPSSTPDQTQPAQQQSGDQATPIDQLNPEQNQQQPATDPAAQPAQQPTDSPR
jgi:preprotein translocase subunit SecG